MLRRAPGPVLALAVATAVGLTACAPSLPSATISPAASLAAAPSVPPVRAPGASLPTIPGDQPPASASPAQPSMRPRVVPPVPATPVLPTATRRTAARLQALLDSFRATESAPGIAATILYPDGSTWTGVSGLADIAARRPVTPDTAFPLASISKTFLAALVLELSGEGAFGLEDRVAMYLPERRFDPAITVRMLLDHTSGLRDFFEHRDIDRALQTEPSASWTADRALGYLDKPYFPAGTGWHYSNTNYLVLGLLVERVTGRTLAAELRDRFLEPLGLDSAWFQSAEPARRPLAHGYRLNLGSDDRLTPEDLDDGSGIAPFRSVVTAAGGAGALAGDSRDVARWARALYGGDAIDDESLSIMLAGVDEVAGYQPRVPYGLGVQVFPVNGRPTFGHSGRFLGFRAVMRWLPEEELAIAVLSNQSRADLGPLAARMLRIVLPGPAPCPCPAPR